MPYPIDIEKVVTELNTQQQYYAVSNVTRAAHYVLALKAISQLREANASLRSAFHINMLRAWPEKSHDEIAAAIIKLDGTTDEPLRARMTAHIAEFKAAYKERYGIHVYLIGNSTGATGNYQLLRGYLLGKGYSFDEIDASDGLWSLTRSTNV